MTKADEPIDYTAMGRLDLLQKARQDHRDLKAAKQSGEPIPATPFLDELHRRYEDMTSTRKTTTATEGRTKGRTDIRYFHDGRSMSETHKHKLSTLAYFHSHDLKAATPTRLSTKEFVAVLKLAGVVDPGEPGWMVKLPNGITVECRTEGEPSQFKGEAPARKRSSTKATAKPKADKVPASLKGAQSPDKLAPKGAETRKPPAKVSGTVKKQTPGAKAREAARKDARVKRTPAAKKATPAAKTGSRKVTPIPKAKDAKKAHAKAS